MNYVISLKRSVIRRKNFKQNNSLLEFQFFDAIDGQALSKQQILDKSLFDDNLAYTKGAYGCALSHLALWDLSIKNNISLTIIEDDAIVRNDFERQKAVIFEKQHSNWDIILWGWNFDHILSIKTLSDISPVIMLFNQEQMRKSISNFSISTHIPILYELDKTFGIPAYSITPQGALTLKENCFPLKNFELQFPMMEHPMINNGIDIAMNALYSRIRAFVAFPPLAITKNEHETSTIQNGIYFK